MARTVTWSPAPGELFRLSETATNISYDVSVDVVEDPGPSPVVLSYDVEITPVQTILDVTSDANGVNVSAAELTGLFPLQFLDYLNGGVLERVYSWDDLPAGAEDLIEYRPSSDSSFTFTMTVTANLDDATQEQAVYTMVVLQNWTAGRDRLVAEVDARR